MISRSAPLSCARVQRAPHLAQHRYAPVLTRTYYVLETAPELSDLHRRTRCRACWWLGGERLFDLPARLGEMRRHGFDDGVFCGTCGAAKFKLQAPSFRRVGHAPQFEGSDLRQKCAE